ncbi:MAG: UV DNA damage repair endonuclease UvsE [candidate division WOR-3 bacterium]|nr:UV DNA damage repair endonuclease UvsE [candidate division WOR-3 bacterium]
MKLGYPCINRSIGCTANSTFRLASYSEKNLIEKVANNLNCLQKILEYNFKNNFLFFRISSDIVPFASHPICKFKWQTYFQKEFSKIGEYIRKHKMRISMHPDQFVLLNALRKEIVERSINELIYHGTVLDLMGLDTTAKIQIHIGGVYGDKEKSIKSFINRYQLLPAMIKERLVIENDHIAYAIKDCLRVSQATGIPVVFDYFHFECLNNRERLTEAVKLAATTWQEKDGCLIIDYSSQKAGAKIGTHTEHINLNHFKRFINKLKKLKIDFDIMLEIKDKEKSALKAQALLSELFDK